MNRPKQQISRLAFLLAALLIAVTAASLVFVGFVASRASTEQAIANEQRLFRNTLADRMRALVREQLIVTYSDKSVKNLVRDFDADYARKSFDTLWTNYRYSKMMLISGNGDVLAESFEHYTHIIRRPIAETPGLDAVFQDLKGIYVENRVRVPGGFGYRSLRGRDPGDYAAMGFVHIDGKPALFGAMPVIPDEYETTLPGGPPTVLLIAQYIDDTLLDQLNARLKFASLAFVPGEIPAQTASFHQVVGQDGERLGHFRWDSLSVDGSIWPTIIPVIAILSAALALLAFGIAWRIGHLTSSLQASEQQNRYLALHDTLTGLANRLQFNRVLESSVEALPDKPFAVLHCDLDRFKAVNDTFGHAAGDFVIRTMASRLTKIIGDNGLVCRTGGDEFMVIYHGPTRRAHLDNLNKALVESGKIPIPIKDEGTAHLGLSVGISIAPDDGSTAEALVARSDAALYQSKKLGRDRYSFFSDFFGADMNPGQSPYSLEDPPQQVVAKPGV